MYFSTEEDSKKRFSTIKSWYYRPDDTGRVHEALRSGPHYKAVFVFLSIIDQRMSEIPNSLKSFKPLYNQVFGERECPPLSELSRFDYDTWEQLEDLASAGNEEAKTLRNGLMRWAYHFHLLDDQRMYLDIALRAIFHYQRFEYIADTDTNTTAVIDRVFLGQGLLGASRDRIVDEFVHSHPFVFKPTWEALSRPLNDDPDETDRTFQLEWDNEPERYENAPPHYCESPHGFEWDPREEIWADFSRKMQRAFDKYKESYRRRIERFMKQQGYVEIPKEKRKQKLPLHMKWFIDYQFYGKQYKDIADEYSMEIEDGITDRNVSNAVKEISELVLLPLRTS